MTKEELKLTIFKEYANQYKLTSIKLLKESTNCGLVRAKDLIDIIYVDDWDINPILFILHFNLMWKELTKEEKLNIRKYDNRN